MKKILMGVFILGSVFLGMNAFAAPPSVEVGDMSYDDNKSAVLSLQEQFENASNENESAKELFILVCCNGGVANTTKTESQKVQCDNAEQRLMESAKEYNRLRNLLNSSSKSGLSSLEILDVDEYDEKLNDNISRKQTIDWIKSISFDGKSMTALHTSSLHGLKVGDKIMVNVDINIVYNNSTLYSGVYDIESIKDNDGQYEGRLIVIDAIFPSGNVKSGGWYLVETGPVTPPTVCSITNFSVTPTTITKGNPVYINWQTNNCDWVTLSTQGSVSLSGSKTLYPSVTTGYGLIAGKNNGSDSLSSNITTVNVNNNSTTPVAVIYPNGGEKLELGRLYTIDTNIRDLAGVNTALIHYLYNENGKLGALFSSTNSSSYPYLLWQTGKYVNSFGTTRIAPTGDKYKIQVCVNQNNCDMSDNYFSITNEQSPSITVLSPNNGGEAIESGQKVEIRWTSTNIVGAMTSVYVSDGIHKGKTVQAKNSDRSVIYTLDSSLVPGSNYKAYVSIVSDSTLNDSSDHPFTIKKAVSLEDVCCESFGYGAYMIKTALTYEMMSKDKCAVSAGYTGGGKNIVANSYCLAKTTTNTSTVNTKASSSTTQISRTLKLGTTGEDVKTLQSFLGITADGKFGKITKAKVIEWQKKNGLTGDGFFGKMSVEKAGLMN